MKKLRYKVTGTLDGVPCLSVFKILSHATLFAESLKSYEIYDIEMQTTIAGNTPFFIAITNQREATRLRGIL